MQLLNRALNLIAAYFKYGYYKNPREIVRLGQALNKDRAMGRAFSELETALKTKPIFEVVPYDNGRRGLLVAKIQIKDKTAQIPLQLQDLEYIQEILQLEVMLSLQEKEN